MKSPREIVEALKVIKAVCMESNCESCPLRDNEYSPDSCKLATTDPSEWEINDPDEWKAF